MQSKRQKVGLENYIQKMEQDGDKYFLHNGKFEGYVRRRILYTDAYLKPSRTSTQK